MQHKIVNNFLPDFYYNAICNNVMSGEFPWYFINSSSGAKEKIKASDIVFPENQSGFFHVIYSDSYNVTVSNNYALYLPITDLIKEKFDVEVCRLIRIRIGLTLNMGVSGSHYPHVDMYQPHKTLLYYFNDSDGDTIFYNKKFGEDISDGLSVDFTNTPQKNQAVLFDGLTYHSSSFPTKNSYRMTMNINFLDSESF